MFRLLPLLNVLFSPHLISPHLISPHTSLGTIEDTPYLVTEYVARGSLFGLLKNTTVVITPQIRIKIAKDASEGLCFLHSLRPPRIHRDLKVHHPSILMSLSVSLSLSPSLLSSSMCFSLSLSLSHFV